MYCEYLIREAKSFPEKKGDCLGQFFLANYGLVFKFSLSFGVQEQEKEDFVQLCYLALVQAVEAWQNDRLNSLLSYYRRCALHQFYVYKLEMRYPVKMSRVDFRTAESGEITFECTDYQSCYGDLDDRLCSIEQSLIRDAVWGEIDRVLQYRDALLLKRRFQDCAAYGELSKEFGEKASTLRFRQHHLLTRLKKNNNLRQLAKDAFGIQ